MGEVQSIEVGTKSSRKDIQEEEYIDFKNPKNITKAKKELYNLFIEDKLILSSDLVKAKEIIEQLTKENKQLKSKIAEQEEKLAKQANLSNTEPGKKFV